MVMITKDKYCKQTGRNRILTIPTDSLATLIQIERSLCPIDLLGTESFHMNTGQLAIHVVLCTDI